VNPFPIVTSDKFCYRLQAARPLGGNLDRSIYEYSDLTDEEILEREKRIAGERTKETAKGYWCRGLFTDYEMFGVKTRLMRPTEPELVQKSSLGAQ
jgi:hypothetical protein